MYTFTEADPIGNDPVGRRTRVFVLRKPGQKEWEGVSVWWSEGYRRANCCVCSTPLVAMSASCVHAKALKRYMTRADATGIRTNVGSDGLSDQDRAAMALTTEQVEALNAQRIEDAAASAFGVQLAARLFAGRKGPCSYMQLSEADVANIAAAAYEEGSRRAAVRATARAPQHHTWCTQNGINKDVLACTGNSATCECGSQQYSLRERERNSR